MQIKQLSVAEIEEWWSYYERVGRPGPYHRPDYLSLLAGNFEHNNERPELFVLTEGEDVVYYPYIRRSLESVPFAEKTDIDLTAYDDIVSSWYYGGPVASENADKTTIDQFCQAFSTHCTDTGIVAEFVRFDPNIENHDDFPTLDPQLNRQTVPVDLTQSVDTIWNGYEDRNRRAIKQGRKSSIEIDRNYTDADIKAFHSIYMNAMDARNAVDHYRFSYDFFQRILSSELFDLVVARCDNQVIGGFVIAHDDRYSYHYLSASDPDYWDDRVNNLLYHEVVTYMHDTGRELFDFQGGRPGVFKFKKGFSPDRDDFYIGKQVHINDLYANLVTAADDAGIDTGTGYFPAYRVQQSN